MSSGPKRKIIEIYKEIYADNDALASEIGAELSGRGISMFNIMGTPGCGKTTFLTSLIRHLGGKNVLVIEGDLESDIDTVALKKLGIDAFQINTHGGCHLDAVMMRQALSSLDDRELDIIFIENVGNLICPAEYRLGEKKRIVLSSITEGSDKPWKYPRVFETADIVVVNKADFLSLIPFDLDFFTQGVRRINPAAPIIPVSSLRDEGFEPVVSWVQEAIAE